MEITAKPSPQLHQIIITKKMPTFGSRISLSDARRMHERGVVTKSNKCFQRLVEHNFDVKATLDWYKQERERIDNEYKTGQVR